MRSRSGITAAVLAMLLAGATVFADQLVLKDGRTYSGKFIRADASVVEFRVFGKIESFPTSEVAQIIFKEPELINPPSRQAASAPAVQPAAAAITLPEGTPITIRMTTGVDTERHKVGDAFEAVLDAPLSSGGQVLAEREAPVKGRIAYAQESGKLSGKSMLILELTELTVDGRSYLLRTSDYSEVGFSRGQQTATAVGTAAAIGAVVGAIAGGGKGAAIGAATGAAVATGVQVITSGETLRVPAETVLEFKLQRPLTIETP